MEPAKSLRKVIFEFEDGKALVLEGKSLDNWEYICMVKSDYLLPRHETDVLAKIHGGIVRGFVMKSALKSKAIERMVK